MKKFRWQLTIILKLNRTESNKSNLKVVHEMEIYAKSCFVVLSLSSGIIVGVGQNEGGTERF